MNDILRRPWISLLVVAALAGLLIQFDWAIHHRFASLLWRWLSTTAVLFALASPLLLVGRVFPEGVRAEWNRALMLSPILGLLPLAIFVTEFRSRVCVVFFIAALFLFAFHVRAVSTRLKAALAATLGVLVVGALAILIFLPVPVDGLTVHLAGPRPHDFYSVKIGARDDSPPARYSGTYRSESDRPTAIPLSIPQVREAVDSLRLRLGERTAQSTLTDLSFDSSVLLLNFPLVKRPAVELAGAGIIEAKRGFSSDNGLGLTIPAVPGKRPEVTIDMARARALAFQDSTRAMVVRALWALVLAALLLGARYAAGLRADALRSRISATYRALTVPLFDSPISLTRYWRENALWLAGGVALLLVLLWLRTGDNFMHPGLYVEDATQNFNLFYGGETAFNRVFWMPNRYVAFGVYAYAWLVAKLDVLLLPTLYIVPAVLLATMASSMLAFSGLLRNRWSLLFAPTVLGLSGIVHIFLWITFIFQMHVATLILLVLLFYPPPATKIGTALLALALALLIWSGPFSVVTIPLAVLLLVLRLYPDRKKTFLLGFTLVCAFLYYLTARGGTTQPGAFFVNPDMWQHYVVLFVEKILLLDVFGPYAHWKVAVVVGLVAALFRRLRKDLFYVRISVALLLTMVVAHTVYFLTVKYKPFTHRTIYEQIPLFFWYVYLILSLDRLAASLRIATPVLVSLWMLVMGIVYYDNRMHPDKREYPLMTNIPSFLAMVKEQEARRDELKARNQVVTVTTDGFWRTWTPMRGPVARIGSSGPHAELVEEFRVGRDGAVSRRRIGQGGADRLAPGQ